MAEFPGMVTNIRMIEKLSTAVMALPNGLQVVGMHGYKLGARHFLSADRDFIFDFTK
ncbi:MAG: hypothetical protein ACRD99_05085 [Nitrososphaera sp.]